MNTDELEAGRELDAMIARLLFGWQWGHQADIQLAEYVGMFLPGERGRGRWVQVDNPENYIRFADWDWHIPQYSSTINDAWQVVERMGKLGYWAQVCSPWGEDADGYWAGFTPHLTTGWNGMPDHWTQALTAPLAICRASLKAVEAAA